MRDWYCGLGGASQPFFDHGWNVERYDNYAPPRDEVEGLTFTAVQDVQQYDLPLVDLEWFSPPCTEFSHGRVPQIEKPDMTEFLWCLQRTNYLSRKGVFWCLSSVCIWQTEASDPDGPGSLRGHRTQHNILNNYEKNYGKTSPVQTQQTIKQTI